MSPSIYVWPGSEYVWWAGMTFSRTGQYTISPAVVVNGAWHAIPGSGLMPEQPSIFMISW
jgi:hypothetical protein